MCISTAESTPAISALSSDAHPSGWACVITQHSRAGKQIKVKEEAYKSHPNLKWKKVSNSDAPSCHQLSSSDFLWENQGGLEMQRKVPQIQWNPSHLPVNIFHPSLCAEKSSVISRKVWERFCRAKSLISISESPCKIPHQTDFHASTHNGMTRDPDL